MYFLQNERKLREKAISIETLHIFHICRDFTRTDTRTYTYITHDEHNVYGQYIIMCTE